MTLIKINSIADLDCLFTLLANKREWVISAFEEENIFDLTTDLIDEIDELGIKYEVYDDV